VGLILVGLQFTLLGFLVVAALLAISGGGSVAFSGLTLVLAPISLVLAVVVGVMALMANRPGNFRIVPTPKRDAQLVTHGIYKFIRHPMYTSVLLLAASCAWMAGLVLGGFAWLIWVALFGVLLVKANVEERALSALYPEYASYQAKTWRFVTGLF
jgi:protein-S-isoprenylcysteine O-methyltransferase Ste14